MGRFGWVVVVAFAVLSAGACQPLIDDLPDVNPVGGSVEPPPPPAEPPPPPPPPGNTKTPAPAKTPTKNGTKTPTPAPTPRPRPTATPVPTATPEPGTCLGCCKLTIPPGGVYMADVVAARGKTAQQHPEYFTDSTKTCVRRAHWDNYDNSIVANLRNGGLQAINDGGGEIAVKGGGVAKGSGFSEQFHNLMSNGCIHACTNFPSSCYRATCYPAWF